MLLVLLVSPVRREGLSWSSASILRQVCVKSASNLPHPMGPTIGADWELKHMRGEGVLRRLQLAMKLMPRACRICSRVVTSEAAMADRGRGDRHENVAARRARRLTMLGDCEVGRA